MPMYPYHCSKCDRDFDVEMRPTEVGKRTVECPSCHEKKVTRVYTAFFAKTSRKA